LSLRLRLTLVAAAVVAVVVAAASVTTFFVMKHELYSQVDAQLAQHAQDPHGVFRGFSPYSADYVAIVTADGRGGGDAIPIDVSIRQVATGKRASFYRNTSAETERNTTILLREIVVPLEGGGAAIVARNIDYIDHDLDRLRLILLLVSFGGVLAAALAGFVVSRATLAPVRRLTAAAERNAQTGDPIERVT
jgi:two-component system sensor histidine kinase MprB